MQIYEKHILVAKADLDQLNHVNNVRYVQWVQDIAEAHWLKNASQSIKDRYYWVLVNHNIEYKGQALIDEKIQIKTFVTKSEGVTSVRKVEMYKQSSGKLIIQSETKWCLINTETNRPSRITPEIANLFN